MTWNIVHALNNSLAPANLEKAVLSTIVHGLIVLEKAVLSTIVRALNSPAPANLGAKNLYI